MPLVIRTGNLPSQYGIFNIVKNPFLLVGDYLLLGFRVVTVTVFKRDHLDAHSDISRRGLVDDE